MIPGLVRPGPRRHAYATDFSEFATGADPAGWTRRFTSTAYNVTATGAMPGARGPHCTPAAATVACLSMDAAGSAVGDCDIVCAIYPSSTSSGQGLVARGSGSTGYVFQTLAGGTQINISKPNVASLSTVSFAFAANTLYYMRLRCQGTTISGKIWAASSVEPSAFNISVTDSSYSSGFVGLCSYSNTLCRFGWFCVQTGSGVAPIPQG